MHDVEVLNIVASVLDDDGVFQADVLHEDRLIKAVVDTNEDYITFTSNGVPQYEAYGLTKESIIEEIVHHLIKWETED